MGNRKIHTPTLPNVDLEDEERRCEDTEIPGCSINHSTFNNPFDPNNSIKNNKNVYISINSNNNNIENRNYRRRCENCLQPSHKGGICRVSREYYCEKCCVYGHDTKICNLKCGKCDQYGHKDDQCTVNTCIYCDKCQKYGHTTRGCAICTNCKKFHKDRICPMKK